MLDKTNMETLLLEHFERYPKMQIQDMIKLLYQNEFAGGHIIANQSDSLNRLTEEYCSLPYSSNKPIPFEEIGNGLCRFNLATLQHTNIELTTVNQMFIYTANLHHGSKQRFEEKLNILRQCCQNRELPYSIEKLDTYLRVLQDKCYPPVSHSKEYCIAYSPAYGILKSKIIKFMDIFCRIDALLKTKSIVNIAIDGNCGAGKSTVASLINQIYDSNLFHMDHFFLTPEMKTQQRLKEIGGNVDYVRFRKEVITGLQSGSKFDYRKYDCKKMDFGETISVIPKRLNIIEGSYSMHKALIDYYDFKIFLGISPKEQQFRLLKRNGAFMQKRFIQEWIPLENMYFQQMKIKERSDMVYEDNTIGQNTDMQ